jgi:DinB superfamily
MPAELAAQFRKRLAAADAAISGLTEERASTLVRDEGWLRKEVLGHLIDSSINNHVRFVAAAAAGEYAGPSYDQPNWVRLNGYAAQTWADVLTQWRMRNSALGRVVEYIPADALGTMCKVGKGEPVTLEFLIIDYLDHLEGHISQITS